VDTARKVLPLEKLPALGGSTSEFFGVDARVSPLNFVFLTAMGSPGRTFWLLYVVSGLSTSGKGT
jgi:hypothetical protein